MSLENVANEDMDIDLSNSAGPPDLIYTGSIKITDPAVTTTTSTKCKANSKGICTTVLTLAFVVTTKDCPHTSLTYDFVSGGGAVSPSSTKTKAENHLVLREGDEDSIPTGTGCVGTWKLKASPFTVSPCACGIEITNAGQTKVKAQ